MLYQITSFLLDIAAGLFGGACLLRMYMQYQRVPFGNPVGRFVFALAQRSWSASSAPAPLPLPCNRSPTGLNRRIP